LKPQASRNKDWGWKRWAELARQLSKRGHTVTQFASRHCPALPGARLVRAKNFRHACALVESARVAVLPEGGLHHAAAAFRTATIVLFGGFISPAQTGYAHHVNLFTGGVPCGRRNPCSHCTQAMRRISVDEVLAHTLSLLRWVGPVGADHPNRSKT
jgi:ADP-heptose:LPS heptosyltransferase